MFATPPSEKERTSWLFVSLWTLIIYLTIPFARTLQKFVAESWGSTAFTYFVIVSVSLGAIAAMVHLIRRRNRSVSGYIWLTAVAGVFIWYTLQLSKNPEEALHFVQYAFLGGLLFRALTHRTRDISIYFTAVILGSMIGTLDEVIQWLTPDRFWGLGDIWLNTFAVSLCQIAIAMGLRPAIIAAGVTRPGLRITCRVGIAFVLFMGLCALNTPQRIAWYAEKLPSLAFLVNNESVMFEYGYLYSDPEIGQFKSRLDPETLRQTDDSRAEEAAAALDSFRLASDYDAFLKKYTPVTDPFLHEARVHLFRRDRYIEKTREAAGDPIKVSKNASIAFRENLLMLKYFPNVLASSSYGLDPVDLQFIEGKKRAEYDYRSPVSKALVTQLTEGQLTLAFLTLLLTLLVLDRRVLGNRKTDNEVKTPHLP